MIAVDRKTDDTRMQVATNRLGISGPGVGPRLAETVVVHLDDPHRFKSVADVSSYAGLNPSRASRRERRDNTLSVPPNVFPD
jgi:transposase